MSLKSPTWYFGLLIKNPIIYNIIHMLVFWFARTNDSSTNCLTFQVFFFFHNSYRLRAFKTFCFHFCNFIKKTKKKKTKGFLQRILQDFMKKRILEKSDTWSTSRLSNQPSKLAYYIVDWRISIYQFKGNQTIKFCCEFWSKIMIWILLTGNKIWLVFGRHKR